MMVEKIGWGDFRESLECPNKNSRLYPVENGAQQKVT